VIHLTRPQITTAASTQPLRGPTVAPGPGVDAGTVAHLSAAKKRVDDAQKGPHQGLPSSRFPQGVADSRAYHRFVLEGEAYLRDGKVQKERQIRVLAHHLDGKAYAFYMQKVASDDPRNWSLHRFFTELFNFCFPTDYRQQMRLKLEDIHQKPHQPVTKFIYELQELFSMVGAMPPEMKVVKLWYTLKTRIQKALWRDGLHPDTSTWDEVVAKAEIIEIADNVIDPRERRAAQSGSSSGNNKNSQPNNFNNNYKQRHATNGSSSRSVTYINKDRNNNRSHQNGSNSERPNNQQQGSARPGNQRSSRRSQSRGRNTTPRNNGDTSNSNSGKKKKSVRFAHIPEQEMAQLRAENRCFLCKEIGHISRNCPHNNTMPGNGGNKPPGIPSYSMNMNLIEEDGKSGEFLESMPVGSISMDVDNNTEFTNHVPIIEEWRKWYPTWQGPRSLARSEIGDCYKMTIEYALTISQPYPGDELWGDWTQGRPPYNRFHVARLRKNVRNFIIYDKVTDFSITLHRSQVDNCKFNIGRWYAKSRARYLELKKPKLDGYHETVGHPLAFIAQNLLESGIHAHFPNVNPETDPLGRFFVHLKDWGSPTYVIIDEDLQLKLEIDRSLLENPHFNLIGWYQDQIKENGMFYTNYIELHKRRYLPLPNSEENVMDEHLADLVALADLNDDYLDIREELLVLQKVNETLERCAPYPGDDAMARPVDPRYKPGRHRFILYWDARNLVCIYDRLQGFEAYLSWDLASWDQFSLGKWFAERCAINHDVDACSELADEWMRGQEWYDTTSSKKGKSKSRRYGNNGDDSDNDDDNPGDAARRRVDHLSRPDLSLNGVQVDRNKYVNVQRNAARTKDVGERILPKLVVIRIDVNGLPVRALVDSGSLGDFVSSTLVDQLKLKRTILEKPLGLQLAVQGSRSKINALVEISYSYQDIKESRRFDVANLNDYDIILGTPWIYQHSVCIGLNPARIVIGSNKPLPITSGTDTKYLLGTATLTADENILLLVKN
jgi:hypothetical protein